MCAGTVQRRIVSCKRDAFLIVCSYFSSPTKFVAVCVVHVLFVFACALTKRMDVTENCSEMYWSVKGDKENKTVSMFFCSHETCAISVVMIVIIIIMELCKAPTLWLKAFHCYCYFSKL